MSLYPECSAWRHLFAYRGLARFGVIIVAQLKLACANAFVNVQNKQTFYKRQKAGCLFRRHIPTHTHISHNETFNPH